MLTLSSPCKSLSFDWQYITTSCFTYPLQALTNAFIGYIGCTVLFIGIYYGGVWDAMKFPFLSQQLFSSESNSTLFDVYNQSAILSPTFELDPTALATQGLPFFATTNAAYLLTTNLGVTAAITHIALFNRDALRNAFDLGSLRRYLKNPRLIFSRRSEPTAADLEALDPHYRMMLAYKEVPNWSVETYMSYKATVRSLN